MAIPDFCSGFAWLGAVGQSSSSVILFEADGAPHIAPPAC
jgi:hypothetical protein